MRKCSVSRPPKWHIKYNHKNNSFVVVFFFQNVNKVFSSQGQLSSCSCTQRGNWRLYNPMTQRPKLYADEMSESSRRTSGLIIHILDIGQDSGAISRQYRGLLSLQFLFFFTCSSTSDLIGSKSNFHRHQLCLIVDNRLQCCFHLFN